MGRFFSLNWLCKSFEGSMLLLEGSVGCAEHKDGSEEYGSESPEEVRQLRQRGDLGRRPPVVYARHLGESPCDEPGSGFMRRWRDRVPCPGMKCRTFG